jgi:hypothetical protein
MIELLLMLAATIAAIWFPYVMQLIAARIRYAYRQYIGYAHFDGYKKRS